MNNLNYHTAKFILKKRSVTFHVVAALFTVGIWAILYLVMKAGHSDYETKFDNKPLHNNTSPKPIISETKNPEVTKKETIIRKKSEYPTLLGNSILKWAYYDENLFVLPEAQVDYDSLDFDYSSGITFEKESDNQYDKNAVRVLYKNNFLGYLYKGQIQDMVNNYLDKEAYSILAQLSLIDIENKKIAIQIGFYKIFDENEYDYLYRTKATLTKTAKKNRELGTDRQDNYIGLEEGELVEIEENYDYSDYDSFIVFYNYSEIGELSASVSEKLQEYSSSKVLGKIIKVTENDNGTMGAKIEVFVIE